MTATADTRTARPDVDAPTALAEVMADRGLTVAALAAAARVNPATLHVWSVGRKRPRGPGAERVAAALGEPAERLFPHLAGRAPLRAALDRQGLSARDLARRIEAHENSVYSWVTGQYNPQHPELAERAAAALGVPAADLFPDLADRLTQAPTAAPATAAWQPTPPPGPAEPEPGPARPAERGGPSRLAAALTQQGMTATGLARAVKVNPSTVGKWAGGAAPSVEHAEQAAAALGVEAAGVFDRVHLGHRGGRGGRLELPLVPGAPTVSRILDTPATGDPRWADQAACANPDLDPETWWPDPTDRAEQARRVCGGCPVLGDCRQAFLDDPQTRSQGADGIWAGLPGRVLLALTPDRDRDAGRNQAAALATRAAEERAPVDPRQAGRRLAALMGQQGVTSARLAADLGVTRAAVAQWRTGRHAPGGDLAERAAHRLGVDRLWPARSREGMAR